MSGNTEVKRPVWVVPVTAFLIGLLIGWWLIGWWLWPVQWTNALPSDLRAAERDQYLMMVAESFAASRNADQARERLKWWSADELAKHLAGLQERVGVGTPQAAQIQALAELMAVGRPAQPAKATPTVSARSEAAPAPGAGLVAVLRGIITVVVWLVLFVAALVVVYLLWAQWRKAHQAPRTAAIDVTARTARPAPATQRTLDEIAAEGKERWVGEEEVQPSRADVWKPVTDVERPDLSAPAAPAPVRPSVPAGVTPPRPAMPAGVTPPRSPATGFGGRALEFRALYQMGEPDYDEAFDITDADGNYLGQCGLELNDPVGRGHDQAAALQAWLWDHHDPGTKVKVLMSEGAYRDTAMRDQLKGEHEAIPVRAGTEFELETHTMVLRGTVEKVEYADADPPYTIFAELMVRFRVMQKA